MRRLLLAGWLILLSFSAHGVIETYQFDTDVQRARYHHFIEELRCPKCQNQNLSGSDSAISKDLRRQIHQMIMDDKSDIEITQYMVARYGDFILYRPQFNAATAVLWLTPLALLLLGLLVWWRMAATRAKPKLLSDQALSVTEQQQLKDLLDEENSASKDGGNK
ncbi:MULTISPECIES: cytochrome c-type biogenesis protein CcmH [Zhongshania]|jgi:cytochrome c-type biogenesis protein CcmH|uniref:Cytochrome c-type biogenesis protein n=1 Tax=Zhongshania antarctica TaxID=641702 RepID=A0A840QZB3_9GAMM|nr:MULTISPECIES: cytochrome c-type biogenesis protein [Zhongshania]MBB5185787.1 cytochrome c-type biogenesis protein CcmH [Zhongshania antarctica]